MVKILGDTVGGWVNVNREMKRANSWAHFSGSCEKSEKKCSLDGKSHRLACYKIELRKREICVKLFSRSYCDYHIASVDFFSYFQPTEFTERAARIECHTRHACEFLIAFVEKKYIPRFFLSPLMSFFNWDFSASNLTDHQGGNLKGMRGFELE